MTSFGPRKIVFSVFEDKSGKWRFSIKLDPRAKVIVSSPYCNLEMADKAARYTRDALRNRERQSEIVSPKRFEKL